MIVFYSLPSHWDSFNQVLRTLLFENSSSVFTFKIHFFKS